MRRAAVLVAAVALAAPAAAAHAGQIAFATPAGITIVDDAFTTTRTIPLPGVEDVAWSPDGTRLAYSHFGATSGIDTIAAGGSDDRRLTVAPPVLSAADAEAPGFFFDVEPAWSPDGAQLVYAHGYLDKGSVPPAVWEVGADGTDPHQLVASTAEHPFAGAPSLVAGGTRLDFVRDFQNLWAARPDGGDPQPVVVTTDANVVVLPAPDGRSYALGYGGTTGVLDTGGRGLRLVGPRGYRPRTYATDGHRLLLTEAADKPTRVVLADPSGAVAPRVIDHAPAALADPDAESSWFRPGPPAPAAPAAPDHAAPVSILTTWEGDMVALHAPGTHRLAHVGTVLPQLVSADQTGVRTVSVAWVRGHARPRWHDDTTDGAWIHDMVAHRYGTWHLLVRATDVLGTTTKHPTEAIVRLTRGPYLPAFEGHQR